MSSTYLAAEARGNNRLLTPEIWARFLAKRAHDPSRVGFIFDDFENVAQWAGLPRLTQAPARGNDLARSRSMPAAPVWIRYR